MTSGQMDVDIERYGDRGFLSDVVAHGEHVWISGTVADPNCESIEDQTRCVLGEIDHRLQSAGSSKAQLVSVNIWLADMNDWSAMNQIWIDWLHGTSAPCRAVVGATLIKPFKIEIAAVAVRAKHV